MKKPPTVDTNVTISVLSVSPIDEDCVSLERIFNDSEWTAYTNSKWALIARSTLASAVAAFRQNPFPIVLCEADLLSGTWREMLEQITLLPNLPLLIVTSPLADERLWAEALNLGAYDVLAKPFEKREVVRILSMAWLHWKDRQEIATRSSNLTMAASV